MLAWSIILIVAIFLLIWIGWRVSSRKQLLPCPSELAWLVEIENPLARATRSEQVILRLNLPRGSRVIDFGCGPGRVTVPLAKAIGSQGEVVAVDVQSEMLEKVRIRAKQEGLTNIRFCRADGNRDTIGVTEADAAVMVMMVGEVTDTKRLLTAAYYALKPAGRLLVAESIFDPHYVRRAKLKSMMEGAGFSEVSHSGNVFGYNAIFEKTNRASQSLEPNPTAAALSAGREVRRSCGRGSAQASSTRQG